jgi:hypothetical protein
MVKTMKCRVAYTVNGLRAHTTVHAESTSAALQMVLKCLPEGVQVAAVVSRVKI